MNTTFGGKTLKQRVEKQFKYNKCEKCGKESEDVVKRLCGFQKDVWEEEVWETICDDCEQIH